MSPWLDPKNLGPQLGLSTASVFTLIAFLLSLGRSLPRVGYLTRADLLVVCSTILVFGALIESVTASRFDQANQRALALKLNHYARRIYPARFVLIVLLVSLA